MASRSSGRRVAPGSRTRTGTSSVFVRARSPAETEADSGGSGILDRVSPRRPPSPPRPKREVIEADTPSPEPEEVVTLDPDDPPYETRPRFSRGDQVDKLRNDELARIFYEIGDMLELRGEMPFKVGAYRRGAESILHSSIPIVDAYRRGAPPRLPGVGKAIDEKLAELADTGRLRYYERLRRDVPPSLVSLLAVPGLGPRTAGDLWRALGISTLEELEAAAKDGRLRSVKGMSTRTEEKILDGLSELRTRPPKRMRLGEAEDAIARIGPVLAGSPGVRNVVAAGSWRRRRETVGDLDILVETD